MPSGADLKLQLERLLASQQDALARADAAYQVERTRITRQIASTQKLLTKWDVKANELIDTLAEAGIVIKTE